MRTGRILALARCSERSFFKIMAVGCCAAAFFFSVSVLGFCRPAAALSVDGMPAWLEDHVTRGLLAVWNEIPQGQTRADTLALVARRLFSGYEVTVEQTGRGASVVFNALSQTRWNVLISHPELRAPTDVWFARDTAGMADEISALLEGLPIGALSWADTALKRQVEDITERRLPGWSVSLLARIEAGGGENDSASLQVTFHPRQPLVLAISPSIFSSTLPVMFQADLKARLIPEMSPIIGLPVDWVSMHRREVELLVMEFLEDRNAVSYTRSNVEISFVPGQVSRVDAAVNSERFTFQIWFAIYSGMKERHPEAGLLTGLNTRRWTGLDLEIYNEAIIDISQFELTNRLGLRFNVLNNLHAGVEMEWPAQEVWYRAWWTPARVRRPYAWWRYSPTFGHNFALGYRINEHLSIEFHYDERYENKIGLRGILLL